MKKLMFWIAIAVGVLCVVGGMADSGDGSPAIIFGVVILGCLGLYKFFPRNNWFSLYYKRKVLDEKQRVLELEAKIKDLEAKIEEK